MTGLFASAYLLFEYITGGPIVCGMAAGCEVVRGSAWAHVWGIPRPVFGVVFYFGMMLLLIIRSQTPWQGRMLRNLMAVGAIIGLIESAHLFFIQWLVIHAFCVWCLTSGAATVLVAALSLSDKPNLTEEERLTDLKGYTLAIFLLMLIGAPAFYLLVRRS